MCRLYRHTERHSQAARNLSPVRNINKQSSCQISSFSATNTKFGHSKRTSPRQTYCLFVLTTRFVRRIAFRDVSMPSYLDQSGLATELLSDQAIHVVGLRPFACWDSGFESRPGTWMSVSCECCALSGRGLCDGLITRPEEFYRVWSVQ